MRALIIAAASLLAMLSQSATAESLGEHPAVLIKRHAATQPVQPAYLNFYLHPAHFDLLTQAPADDEPVAKTDEVPRHKIATASSQRDGSITAAY